MAADPPVADPRPDQRKGAFRIRLGVGLVLISWLPFAQLAIDLTGATGSDADHIRYLIWTMQVMRRHRRGCDRWQGDDRSGEERWLETAARGGVAIDDLARQTNR